MTIEYDFAQLQEEHGLEVLLADRVVVRGQQVVCEPCSGFSAVAAGRLRVQLWDLRGEDNPSIAVLVEGSSDGVTWAAIEAWSFLRGDAPEVTTDVVAPADFLRVTVTPGGGLREAHVSAGFVPNFLDAPVTGGGGAGLPTVIQGRWGDMAGGQPQTNQLQQQVASVPGTDADHWTIDSVYYVPEYDVQFGTGAAYQGTDSRFTVDTKQLGEAMNNYLCEIVDTGGTPNLASVITYDPDTLTLTIRPGTDSGGVMIHGDQLDVDFRATPEVMAIFTTGGYSGSPVLATPLANFSGGTDGSRYYSLLKGNTFDSYTEVARREYNQDSPEFTYPSLSLYGGMQWPIDPLPGATLVGGDTLSLDSGQVFGEGDTANDQYGGLVIVTLVAA